MKKIYSILVAVLMMIVMCSCSNGGAKAIELMGAGDRIHDTYTFANKGVNIDNDGNKFVISGSVEKLESDEVKKEFKIDDDITHVIAIKLQSIDQKVEKDKVKIMVDGIRSYDAEHLNGSDYTFIILEAIPGNSVFIKVKWNSESDKELTYNIVFDENLILK